MSKQNYYLAAGALLCSAFSGLALPLSNVFAEGATSVFDPNAQACIIENYNNENGTSITTMEEVDFSKITVLECSNRGIMNFQGITLLPNLEVLNLSFNSGLYGYDMNYSQNTKLKSIDVRGLNQTYYDFSHNPELETITTDRTLTLRTAAYAERVAGQNGYKMDLSVLKFVDSPDTVEFPTVNDVPYAVNATFGGRTHQIQTRGGWMQYAIYLNGDEEVETHNPIYLENNCEESVDGYYSCNSSVYYGDTFDTEEIKNGTLAKIFNLSEYRLSKVEIIPPLANVELSVDTDTVKKGKALADANFAIRFYFDLAKDSSSTDQEASTTNSADSASTPETGAFNSGSSQGVSSVAIIGSLVAGIATSIIAFPKIRRIISKDN